MIIKYFALTLSLTVAFATSAFAHGITKEQKEAVHTFCEAESHYSYNHPFKKFCKDFRSHDDAYDAADIAGAVSGDFNDYISSRDAAKKLIKKLGMENDFRLKKCN